MKPSVKKQFFILPIIAVILTAVFVIFRTALLFFHFDADIGQFANGAAADLVFPTLIAVSALLFFAFGVKYRAALGQNALRASIPVSFAAAFGAVATLVYAISQISSVFNADNGMQYVFGILMLICSLGPILYFVFGAIGTIPDFFRAICGIFTIFFCVFYILFTYFDDALMLNNPNKVFDQLTLLVLTVFFIAECRFFFKTVRYSFYLPIAMLTMLLCAVDSLPALIYTLKNGTPLMGSITHDFMIFAFALYAAMQLFGALNNTCEETKTSAYAQEIAEESLDLSVKLTQDPDQEVFDFDSKKETPTADSPILPPEEPGEFDTDAQTTLDFKKPQN